MNKRYNNMGKKWILTALCMILTALTLTACSEANDVTENKISLNMDSNKLYVGFLIETLQQDRWYKDKEIFETAIKELGGEVKTLASNGIDDVQIKQAQLLIDEGVDVLAVVPHNAEIASVIVDMAHKANVKVLSYDRLIKNADVDYYISFDNEKVGELQATEILKHVNKGNFALVGGDEMDNNAVLLRQGAMNVLQPLVDQGDITISYDKYTKGWNEKIAEANMTEALNNNNNIQAVISANDSNAGGAIRALTKAGIKIPVSGQDADVPALRRIIEGSQTMTVYKPIQQLAEEAAKLSFKIANSEDIQTDTTINNGKIDVPSILLVPTVVTKDNIKETVIKDKQVTEEEVYQ